jgi:hypothetical protein
MSALGQKRTKQAPCDVRPWARPRGTSRALANAIRLKAHASALIVKILRRFLAAIVADQLDDLTAIGYFNFMDPHRLETNPAGNRRRQKPWVILMRLRHYIAPPLQSGARPVSLLCRLKRHSVESIGAKPVNGCCSANVALPDTRRADCAAWA